MATSTTPAQQPPSTGRRRSNSQTRNIPSRPTTPLRPPSRTSLRASQTTPSGGASISNLENPLPSLEPAFAELSDSMADLEANFMHLQLLNESLSRFNENFGAFLYGMNMSAFCVDFPEAPIQQSFAKHKEPPSQLQNSPFRERTAPDPEATFLTTDTSFIENPPTSVKPASKYSAPPAARGSRQTMVPGRAGTTRGTTGSGVVRNASTRGGAAVTAGTSRAGSSVGRGISRGRGFTR